MSLGSFDTYIDWIKEILIRQEIKKKSARVLNPKLYSEYCQPSKFSFVPKLYSDFDLKKIQIPGYQVKIIDHYPNLDNQDILKNYSIVII